LQSIDWSLPSPLPRCNRLIDHRCRRCPIAIGVAVAPVPHCHCNYGCQ
jgi:hypothetical protein